LTLKIPPPLAPSPVGAAAGAAEAATIDVLPMAAEGRPAGVLLPLPVAVADAAPTPGPTPTAAAEAEVG
jgi:hypothetical protein